MRKINKEGRKKTASELPMLMRMDGSHVGEPPVHAEVSAFQGMDEQQLITILNDNIKSGKLTTEGAESIIKGHSSSIITQRRIMDAIWSAPQFTRIAAEKGQVAKQIDHLPKVAQKMWRDIYENAKKHAMGKADLKGRAKEYAARTAWSKVKDKYPDAVPMKKEKKSYYDPIEKGADDYPKGGYPLKPDPREAEEKMQNNQENTFKTRTRMEYKDREGTQRGSTKSDVIKTGGRNMKTRCGRLSDWYSELDEKRTKEGYYQGTMEQEEPEGGKSHRLDLPGGPVMNQEEKWYSADARATEQDIKKTDKEKERTQRAKFEVRFEDNPRNRMASAWLIRRKGEEKPCIKAVIGDITEGEFPPDEAYLELSNPEQFGADILDSIEENGIAQVAYELTGQKVEEAKCDDDEKKKKKKDDEKKKKKKDDDEKDKKDKKKKSSFDSFANIKIAVEKATDRVEQVLVAFDEFEIEDDENKREELNACVDELYKINDAIIAQSDKEESEEFVNKLGKVASVVVAEADEKAEGAEALVKQLSKVVTKLKKELGITDDDEEKGAGPKGKKDLGLPGVPKAPKTKPEAGGPDIGAPMGGDVEKKPALPSFGGEQTRGLRRRAVAPLDGKDSRPEYGVVPPSDYTKLAHPSKSKDPVVKEVEDDKEKASAMEGVARKAPRGIQGRLRRAVKGTPEQAKYYGEMYGDKQFAKKLTDDYSGKKENVQASAEEAKIKMKLAMDLGLEAQEKGMIEETKESLDGYVDTLYNLSDDMFETMASSIRKMQRPDLHLKEGHYEVKVVGDGVTGYIDNIRVGEWNREGLSDALMNDQIVMSTLKATMKELKEKDASDGFKQILNARLSGKQGEADPLTMDKVVGNGVAEKPHAEKSVSERLDPHWTDNQRGE